MSFDFRRIVSFLALFTAHLCASTSAASAPQYHPVPYIISTDNNAMGMITVEEKIITITAKKGTDLFTDTAGKTHADNTPRALFQPAGDFILSAKVAADLPLAYDGAALIIYADDHHWAKLLFERFESGQLGIATTVTSTTGDDAYHGTRTSAHQYLKIARRGNSYVFYSSPNGEEWNFLRHFSISTERPIKIGFSAQAPFSDSVTATFSDIRYRAETFKNFWQGE